MEMRFLPDEPIDDAAHDVLALGPFLRQLVSSIEHTTTPFVYGILGDWGAGKTSILHMLRKRVEQLRKPQITIWFNAWKYENEQNMVYPLLYAIRRSYEAEPALHSVSPGFAKSFLKVLGGAALALTDLGLRVVTKKFTDVAIGVKDVKDALERIEGDLNTLETACNNWVDQVHGLDEAFRELLAQYAADWAKLKGTNAEDMRFVIFVDDLDRCLPETVIHVLESVKNFLAVKQCVFVLGINPRVVAEGIRVKYKGLSVDGSRYLEKIINYSFYVPEPALDAVKEFATKQLNGLLVQDTDRKELAPYFDDFGATLKACRFNNPRKIKRILNRYLFFAGENRATLDKFHNGNVVRLFILSEYYGDLFRVYLNQPEIAVQLAKIGTKQFEVKKFEDATGVALTSRQEELSRMSSLFDLNQSTDGGKHKLEDHVRAVAVTATPY
jgi:hypothetical protein